MEGQRRCCSSALAIARDRFSTRASSRSNAFGDRWYFLVVAQELSRARIQRERIEPIRVPL